MKNIKDSCIEFLNNANTLKEIKDILKPLTNSIYNELYIYIWIICFYSIIMFLLILANLYVLMNILNKTKILHMQYIN
jgi:hypothetical protein